MLKQLDEMKSQIEADTEDLSAEEIAYLEQIKTTSDLSNYDKDNDSIKDLVYDVGIAMGLSDKEADVIASYVEPQPQPQPVVDEKALEVEYDSLVRSYNASMSALADAEYYLIEEISAEGFASKKNRAAKAHYEKEAEGDFSELNTFKASNANFVTGLKKVRAEANERAVWNQ